MNLSASCKIPHSAIRRRCFVLQLLESRSGQPSLRSKFVSYGPTWFRQGLMGVFHHVARCFKSSFRFRPAPLEGPLQDVVKLTVLSQPAVWHVAQLVENVRNGPICLAFASKI